MVPSKTSTQMTYAQAVSSGITKATKSLHFSPSAHTVTTPANSIYLAAPINSLPSPFKRNAFQAESHHRIPSALRGYELNDPEDNERYALEDYEPEDLICMMTKHYTWRHRCNTPSRQKKGRVVRTRRFGIKLYH